MQPAENQQEQEQGQGRIIRMGQAQRPVVIVLALKNTYDEQIMARAEIKMMPMIEAQRARVVLTAHEAEEVARGHEDCELLSTNTEARARQLGGERIYQLLTGAIVTMQPRKRADDCEHAAFNACGHVVRRGVVDADGNAAPGTPSKLRMTLVDYAAQKAAAAAKKAAADRRAGKADAAAGDAAAGDAAAGDAAAMGERTPKRKTASGKPRRQREAPKSSETVDTDETDDTGERDGETTVVADSEGNETDGEELAAATPTSEAASAVLATGSRKRKAEAPADGSLKCKAEAGEPKKRKTVVQATAASSRPKRRE